VARIVRKLNAKRNWDNKPWLQEGDVQSAVSSRCLETKDNKLSIFVVEKGEEPVRRVVAALALTRDSLDVLDLAIVTERILDPCEIKKRIQTAGETPDHVVNSWHTDLTELSVTQVAVLAKKIKSQGTILRYQLSDVICAIRTSLDRDWIDTSRIRQTIRGSLERRGVSIP
jgi:hypothetical protein